MSYFLESVRVSEKAKRQLIALKRKTGIENWNVLCRWALCLSLAEGSIPPEEDLALDSNVEMDWRTFGGKDESLFRALMMLRCSQDGLGLEKSVLATQFKLHLHRGISYLASDKRISSIESFVDRALGHVPETEGEHSPA